MLRLLSFNLSLAEFKKFILKDNENIGLIHYLKNSHLEDLVGACQHNVKYSTAYVMWLFLNQKTLDIDLFKPEKGFDIWKDFTGEAHYSTLMKWVIQKLTLENVKQKFCFWDDYDKVSVFFGDFLLLNGNKNNIITFIEKFSNHLDEVFTFSPTNTLCANEVLTIKDMNSLYNLLFSHKTDKYFRKKNDLFSFIEAQTNIYVALEHRQFIDKLYTHGNLISQTDDNNLDCLSLSLQCQTKKENSVVRMGLFEVLWPYAKKEKIDINHKNVRGHTVFHLLLNLIPRENEEGIYLYNNSGNATTLNENTYIEQNYLDYFDSQIKILKENNCDFTIQSLKGNNALHFSFMLKRKEEIIIKLIDLGVSFTQKNKFGHDAYFYLIKYRDFYEQEFFSKMTAIYEKEKLEISSKKLIFQKNRLKL